MTESVSKQTLNRLPRYYNYLKSVEDQCMTISATMIAQAMQLNDVQVRKDLAAVCDKGRPRTGYVTTELIADLERYLAYDNEDNAIIVGVGHLGGALLAYHGFQEYGLNVVAGFDSDESLIGTTKDGKEIFSLSHIQEICRQRQVRIGIICTPAAAAQTACDALVEGGIRAIWNFAPRHLKVPKDVLVQNENMACSLAMLSRYLREKNPGTQE